MITFWLEWGHINLLNDLYGGEKMKPLKYLNHDHHLSALNPCCDIIFKLDKQQIETRLWVKQLEFFLLWRDLCMNLSGCLKG